MADSPSEILKCAICLEIMTPPIILCKNGHSMCEVCIKSNNVTICPLCRGKMSTMRNLQLEQMISVFHKSCKISCTYAREGCKFVLGTKDKDEHENECKFRKFLCEGRKFANWKCNWVGSLQNLEEHFTKDHKNNTHMTFRTEAHLKINLKENYKDINIINYRNGQNFFWYKHQVDVQKKKAYWTFQMIGAKSQARHYYYEFEIFKGPIRKLKVSEICENDIMEAGTIFQGEKCVAVSFKTLQTFMNDNGEISFKFRIMSIPRDTTSTSSS